MIIALQTLIFFRESLLSALDRLIKPYYKRLSLVFSRSGIVSDDDESEEQVFSEYDDERGVVFYPAVYAQRYAAVSDCLMDERWCGKLEKVVDLGYHDMSFVKYLKEVPGVRCILGVDIESIPLRCSSDLLGCDENASKGENPLQITLFQGNAADPDYRLIGCDAVIAIEMIEHMLPHDLDRLVHTTFGFIKPWIVIFTTPNADFNVLFKALERNGLRRLDHFFEWTREQFHDWCSNIVLRYPQYTVTCRGIGPGPPGTLHLGCCSQMALFISKDYQKQQDLNLNSLSLVANAPNYNNLSDMISSIDIPESYVDNMLPNIIESYTGLVFSDKQSGVTIVITSPSFSLNSLEHQDKMSQCNLDSEFGKNFLMFDDEQMCFNIVVPRRKVYNKVYDIEDINSRLNCTTLQVKKFSKTTQNLMVKNKIDSLVHTREVVDEIRHLTKMLNFNKDCLNQHDLPYVWCNINWGENAPYWNQYYNIVREYNYPFEKKSEECRILDLISDEINKLIDVQYDEEFCVEVNKLEIPLQHLMGVVEHITDDVDRVKDLLEWNGYEIVDDVVMHSRLVVDNVSVASHQEDWQDNDTLSDWDTTDFHSTSLSDGNTIVPDYHGRCLHRALDHKVRKLRSMLTADEDITTELDRVMCRLMKLALCTSRGRQNPPPTTWLQCKLLDLLTLTEKAIDRRKRHFIESYPFKAISYDLEEKSKEIIALEKIKEDTTANKLVDKYRHLVQSTGTVCDKKNQDFIKSKYQYIDMELEDDLSVTSTELLKDYEYVDRQSPSLIDPELILNETVYESKPFDPDETKFERVRNWVKEDIEVVPYPNHSINFDNSSGDTDQSTGFVFRAKYKKTYKKFKSVSTHDVNDTIISKTCKSKITNAKRTVNQGEKNASMIKSNKTRLIKKVTRKKTSCSSLLKNRKNKCMLIEYKNVGLRSKNKKEYHNSTPSKPIPESLIKLCHPELSRNKYYDDCQFPKIAYNYDGNEINNRTNNVAATEESFLIDIVMDDMEETIALRRTIGTETNLDHIILEYETLTQCLSHESNDKFCEKQTISTENVWSQTIFLNDINEPSTSKGIRHISTDVQCGPDNTNQTYFMLSATTSYTKMPKLIEIGVKIPDLCSETKVKSAEFGTCTDNNNKTITSNIKFVGIRIQDSVPILSERVECATMTQEFRDTEIMTPILQSLAPNQTKLLKAVSSNLRIEDSGSEFCGSIGSFPKSPLHYADLTADTNDVQIRLSLSREVSNKLSSIKYVRPKLCCGGVHIHSYKEKQVSEDVVYLGEWQRYRSKLLIKKRSLSPVPLNSVVHPIVKRNNVQKNKIPTSVSNNKQVKCEFKNKIKPRNTVLYKPKQVSKTIKNEKLFNINKTPKLGLYKNITKNDSKHTVGAVSPKANKLIYARRKPTVLSSICIQKDYNLPQHRPLAKNYIPTYLRKRGIKFSISNTKNLNESLDTVDGRIKVNKKESHIDMPPLVRSNTEEIKSDLLKFRPKPSKDINYLIFRNEIENKTSASSGESAKTEEKIINKGIANRPHSPESQNSSTCSSPNSVATIRLVSKKPKNVPNKRISTSSQKSNVDDSESETPTPFRIKKFTKRVYSCKSAKKTDNKGFDNKENLPDTTNSNIKSKQSDRNNKNVFKGNHKNVFIGQFKTDNQTLQSTVTSFSKHKPQSSNFKNPSANNVDLNFKSGSPSISKKFIKSESILHVDRNKSDILDNLKTGLYTESQVNKTIQEVISTGNSVESPLGSSMEINTAVQNHNDIQNAMRQLLEETLNFFGDPLNNDVNFESETVVLSREDMNTNHDQNSSIASFKSIHNIDNKLFVSTLDIAADNVLNHTFNTTLDVSVLSLADTNITVTDLDLLSFKSITSGTKLSDFYFDGCDFDTLTPKSHSVREIYERKDQSLKQIPGGALAVQAFSGFSINGESVVGDQPDHINFVDSETGSLAFEIARQANSEELFVSGRSSDSYESCVIGEDAVVPNWLFHIISHQQSITEESDSLDVGRPMPLEDPMPFAEPVIDTNGNTVDPGAGTGTGAGDGRGIHSDHSQDSSGRGTSLSSSETSSGQQSEAIIIDASAFLGRFEAIGERSTVAVPILSNEVIEPLGNVVRVVEEQVATSTRSSREGNLRLEQLMTTSDADADVSSIDTDLPDSSDN